MTQNNTLSYRVGQLEKDYDGVNEKMQKLLVNDIPHLQQGMASLKVRMEVLTAVNVGATILIIIISKFF